MKTASKLGFATGIHIVQNIPFGLGFTAGLSAGLVTGTALGIARGSVWAYRKVSPSVTAGFRKVVVKKIPVAEQTVETPVIPVENASACLV